MISSQVPPETIEARIMRDLHEAVIKQVADIRCRVITEASKKFEDELRTLIGSVALNLSTYYSVERIGGNMVITVKIEKPQ